MENTDPFMAWNDPMYADDPLAPHNNPMYADDPFKPWNNPMGSHDDLNDNERQYYGLPSKSDNGELDW